MKRILEQQTVALFLLCAIVLTGLMTTLGRGAEEDEPEPKPESEPVVVGLRGILPDEVPEDLLEEEFEVLGGSWAEWSAGLAIDVARLYEEEGLDLEAQRKLIAALNSKLAVMERAMSDRRYEKILDPLVSLYPRVKRRVHLAETILDCLDQTPESIRAPRLKTATAATLRKLEALKKELVRKRASGWLSYVRGEELDKQLREPAASEKADGDKADGEKTEGKKVDSIKTVPLLQDIRKRLAGRDTLKVEAQRKFLAQPEFIALDNALGDYLEVATLELKPAEKEKLRETLANLIEAVESYEAEKLNDAASRVHAHREALAGIAVDGGEQISAILRKHYINYNLQIFASERFLSRLVHEERNESRPVNDRLDDAVITGNQSTSAVIRIDTQPSNNGGKFFLTLAGRTISNTTARVTQATIYSRGDHRFWATKLVYFDGERFRTEKASIRVDANNTPVGARTSYDGGLFSGTAQRRAMAAARAKGPRAREHTRIRITERVLPEFETESEKSLQEADKRLREHFHKRLREAGVYPERTNVATSSSHMRMSSRVTNKGELGGSLPNAALALGKGLTIHLHESLLNNVVDRMNFAGRTMTDDEIKKEAERFMTVLAGRDVTFSTDKEAEDKAAPASQSVRSLVFAKTDPIRFRIENGQINLIIRAGFERKDKENIPAQVVTVPLIYTVKSDHILVQTGSVSVAAVEKPKSLRTKLAHAAAIKNKIKKSLPERKRDHVLSMARDDKEDLKITITDIKALGGWLTIWAD